MCLGKVLESYEPPCMIITDGWKSFSRKGTNLQVQMTINGSLDIPLDKWISATDEHARNGVKADDNNVYKPGFHAYADETELAQVQKRVSGDYRRVFLRGITCTGIQDGFKTVVAAEMFVPRDPNGWPPQGDEKSVPTPPAPPVPPTGGKGVKGLIDKMKGLGVTPGEA